MPTVKCCPYCMSTDIVSTVPAFLEIGKYTDHDGYESEGDAEGFICENCKEKFWVNGPDADMCYAVVLTLDGEDDRILERHTPTPAGREKAVEAICNIVNSWAKETGRENTPSHMKHLELAQGIGEVGLAGWGHYEIQTLAR